MVYHNDLFFNQWLAVSKYDKDFLLRICRSGCTPKDFYDMYIMLPFWKKIFAENKKIDYICIAVWHRKPEIKWKILQNIHPIRDNYPKVRFSGRVNTSDFLFLIGFLILYHGKLNQFYILCGWLFFWEKKTYNSQSIWQKTRF